MTTQPRETEFAVIGGGIVGLAVGVGLLWRGCKVAVFDEGDAAFRASRGNFGLVWVQGKGARMLEYARWTRGSAREWPAFAERLQHETGVSVELEQRGGLVLHLSDADAAQAEAMLSEMRAALGDDYPFEMLGHNAVLRVLPGIGPDVVGASFHPEDGHVNPLMLLRALCSAFRRAGGRMVSGEPVARIEPCTDGFAICSGDVRWHADRVVLCAGLGNRHLAPMVGLEAPVRPVRGQVLITERQPRIIDLPTVHVRQTGDGTIQIGDSKEDVGLEDGTEPAVIGRIAARAAKYFPALAGVRVVRSWAALRVMSPDGHPIYQRSISHPGASLVTCHSGVTLAAVHAGALAEWLLGNDVNHNMEAFSATRFALQAA